MDWTITKKDADYVVESLKKIVGKLRGMSPLYEDFVKKMRETSENIDHRTENTEE